MPYYPLKELFPGQRTQVAVGRQRQQRQSVPAQVIAEEEAKKELVEPAPKQAREQTSTAAFIEGASEVTTSEYQALIDDIEKERASYLKGIELSNQAASDRQAQLDEYNRIISKATGLTEEQKAEIQANQQRVQSEIDYYHDRAKDTEQELQQFVNLSSRRLAAARGQIASISKTEIEKSTRAIRGIATDADIEQDFDKAEKEGRIPAGSKIVRDESGKIVRDTKGRWSYITPESKSEYEKQVAIAKANFEDELRRVDPEGYRVYKEAGEEAYKLSISQRQKDQESLLKRLEPFKEGEGYNLAAAISEGKISLDKLQDAGFSLKDIETASRAIPRIQEQKEAIARQEAEFKSQKEHQEAEVKGIEADLKANAPDLLSMLQQAERSGDFTAFNAAVKNYNEGIDYREKDFKAKNTQLPDGNWIDNASLAETKKDTEVYNLLSTKGIDAANKYVSEYNAKTVKDTNKVLAKIDKASTIKEVWRILTPWQEELGESVVDYMKGWPARVKDTYKAMLNPSKTQTQTELKAIYDVQQEARKALWAKDTPFWARAIALVSNDLTVTFDKKSGKYRRIIPTVAPPITITKVATLPRPNWRPIQDSIRRLEMGEQIAQSNIKAQQTLQSLRQFQYSGGRGIPTTQLESQLMQRGISLPSAITKTVPDTKSNLEAAKRLVAILALHQLTPKMPAHIQAPVTATIPKTILRPIAGYDPGYREKIFEKPDVREISRQLEDVRSTVIAKPVTKQTPKELTKQALRVQPLSMVGVSPVTATGTLTRVATTPATTTKTETATKTSTATKSQTATKLGVKTATKIATATRLQKIIDIPLKLSPIKPKLRVPFLLRPDMTDKEKRETIKEAGGAFTWRQGQLHGKPVHHVVVNPFRQQDKTTVLGKSPEGAVNVTGIGQAKRSLRLTRGLAPKKSTRYEGGAVDPIVSPVGKRKVAIRFVPDGSVMRRTNIKQTKPPRFAFRSKKVGGVYRTKIGGGIVLSRRPLGRRR